jgi:hypothetical protein
MDIKRIAVGCVCICLACCVAAPPRDAADRMPGLGMWVWGPLATAQSRKELLAFCAEEKISHIDQHIGIERVGDERSVKNTAALRALVVAAARQDLTVNALRGDPRMFFADHHANTLRDVQAIIDFDRQLPAGVHLAGVKFDVEPYGTNEWRAGGAQREKVMVDYITFLQKARALLQEQAPHLELAVDVPFWWDNQELTVTFAGEEKLLIQHVQDQTDYVGLMSYRPTAQQVLSCGRQELEYAATIGKSMCFGVETGNIKGKEAWISFWGHPPAHFRKSVAELQTALAGNPAARYIMLHHYGSLVKYLRRTSTPQAPKDNR